VHQTGKIRPGWFKIHQFANIAAVLLALAGIILIFVKFRWAGRADTANYYTGAAVQLVTQAPMLHDLLSTFFMLLMHNLLYCRALRLWGLQFLFYLSPDTLY
jgi:hypothetical protein